MNDDLTVRAFFDAWELFRQPALAGTAAGALLGVTGVYVVLRRMVFLTAAVSQAAGLGVAFAYWLRVQLELSARLASPTLMASLFTLISAGLIAGAFAPGSVWRDAALGAVFLAGSAGTLALGTRITAELHDIQTLLFGTGVAVLDADFHLLVSVAAALLCVHLWLWRGFAAVSFDRDGAAVRGVPVARIELALVAILAVSISVATRVLGVLPTFAFSVLPAVAAARVAPNLWSALLLAGAVGGLCGFLGYVAAFLYALPVGAAQTLCGLAAVALAELARGLTRRRSA